MEKENRSLHTENQKFRLKNVSSKISSVLPSTAASKMDVKVSTGPRTGRSVF
jgi:hypothetical protein